jgi:hypothetical protein
MPDENNHLIHVGPHGTFDASGKFNSTPASIDALFASLQQNGCKQMVIYFHGGLVPEENAVGSAINLTPLLSTAGVQPVFFIWETGPWETIRQNVPKILSSKIVKELLMFVLGQVAKRWGIEIPGKGPGETMSFDEIEAELAKPVPFENWDAEDGAKGGATPLDENDLDITQAEMELELSLLMQERSAQLETGLAAAENDPLLSDEIRSNAADSDAKGVELIWLVQLAARTAVQVLRRYMNKQDHGLYPTAVEEILRATSLDGVGKFLWDAMKTKAAEMWLPNPQVLPAAFKDAHVGSYFLDRLVEHAKATPGFHVDLVGHSAGSIVICELLKNTAQRYPGFQFGRIALMAPAARIDLFVKEIVSHPERFEQLRAYIMKESVEMKDAIAGKVYPLSLLYFVSAVLEDPSATPICGLERSLTGLGPNSQGDPLTAHNFFYMPGQNRLVLSISDDAAPPGLRSNAEHHGEFDNPIMSSGKPGETVRSLSIFLQR